jgi:chemotaxis protein methyltransferase CheR
VTAHGSTEAQRFRGWIAQRLGLNFDDTKLEFLADVLERRADKKGLAPRPYLDRLESADTDAELQALAPDLTVPETYFFRHIDQFHAFADVALPQAQSARGSIRKLKILSAGCASGEEPYSLAMLMRERGADLGWDVEIHAMDVNRLMLAKAARGIYSAWALRETPAETQRRWFKNIGKEFELDESIREAVTFHELNLAQDHAALWAPETYDMIFCRNVSMYFAPGAAQALVARITRSLAPGGHLFLGHAETLRGLSDEYHLCHTHGTFYYQRKSAQNRKLDRTYEAPRELVPPQGSSAQAAAASAPAAAPSTTAEPWTKTWLDTVQHASDRIQTLTERPTAASALRGGLSRSGAADVGVQLRLALEFVKQERFADALELLGRLPATSEQDPDVLLLRAALLTHSGDLSAAERASARLLERDELNTGAHYLIALCRESAGDRRGAVEHDQAAIYLDAAFAMPRLHLGLMARRAGDRETARTELSHALVLLKREDASRLLLFGGGFGRDALIALCRAELDSAGGAR